MWGVFDNKKPANNKAFSCAGKEYENNIFPTFEEAIMYARKWLGHWDRIPKNIPLNQDFRIDLSGFGDLFEIKNLDVKEEVAQEPEKPKHDLEFKIKHLIHGLPERAHMRVKTIKVIKRKLTIDNKHLQPGLYQANIEGKRFQLEVNEEQKLTRLE